MSNERPDILKPVTEEQFVELDVRPILRDGSEPFSQIMQTARAVPERHVLRLRATFKPTPLFGVLHTKGWKHWIEHGEGDDWIICFYRPLNFQEADTPSHG